MVFGAVPRFSPGKLAPKGAPRQTGNVFTICCGMRHGAVSTTSKAIVCPTKSGWLASQYCAARTMRRRCLAGSVQAASSRVFSPLHLDEGKPSAFQRHEIDLAHR